VIQVKEFLNYQEGQDNEVNKWLQEKGESIEVIDIKYSVAVFQAEAQNGYNAQEFSGVLIVYKTK
jgi:hypothetical protein